MRSAEKVSWTTWKHVSFIAILFCLFPAWVQGEQHKRATRSKSHCTDLTVAGCVRLADGIGKQAVDLIEILQDRASISFLATSPVLDTELERCSKTVQRVLKTSGAKYPGRVLIYEDLLSWKPSNEIPRRNFWSRFNIPEKSKNQIRIAYTMFESSRAPLAWVHILNNSFDAAVVPDEFLVQVYKESGVKIPIFVIPLGRNLKEFLTPPLKTSRGSPFIFANFSTCFPRKNLLTLIHAFSDVFGNNPDVQLQLCWRQYDIFTRASILSLIASKGLANVKIEEEAVDDAAYIQRFMNVDCYVNIAMGEGFSNQPREAMALGIPVIVTDNTGQKTICASGLVRAIPSDIEVPAMYTYPGDFGVQYQCKQEDAASALRDVFDHYDQYLGQSEAAREWAGQYQSFRMTPLYMSLIKPKRIVLGNEDRILSDGIMTTSKDLAHKYKRILEER
jgi:glycosyltransferase involved in cell wall biosynthesis